LHEISFVCRLKGKNTKYYNINHQNEKKIPTGSKTSSAASDTTSEDTSPNRN